jgi:hypothetical protein
MEEQDLVDWGEKQDAVDVLAEFIVENVTDRGLTWSLVGPGLAASWSSYPLLGQALSHRADYFGQSFVHPRPAPCA